MAAQCYLDHQITLPFTRTSPKFSRLYYMLRSMDFSLHICPQHARPHSFMRGGDFNFRSWFLSHIHIRIISFFSEIATRFLTILRGYIVTILPWRLTSLPLHLPWYLVLFARFFFARHPEVSLYKTIILNLPSDCTVVRMYSSLSFFLKKMSK